MPFSLAQEDMMAIRKRRAALPDAEPERGAQDALALSAEEAEAEAAEAEAVAAAARARAKAIRLRREAEAEAQARKAADPSETPEESTTPAATGEAESAAAEPQAPEGAGRRRLAAIVKPAAAVLAIVVIVGLAGTSGWMVWKHRDAQHQRQLTADFTAAARQGVVSLMSLDFNSAKADVQRILDNSTGLFRQDFESQAGVFAKGAESSTVVTQANVSAAAVKTMTEDAADVLVVANSTITNAQGAKQNPRNWRLIVSMARDGGQIKMAKVEFAP
jgi:Mce-associated membrane protein